ncbi:MAG: hypothetical protein FWD78_14770 [Treponema sp.]|nr:hypothetical protein [Treponema sp.]
MIIHQNKSFTLFDGSLTEGDKRAVAIGSDALVDAAGKYHAEPLPRDLPKIHSGCSMLENMYRVSALDHQSCIIDNKTSLYAACAKDKMNRAHPMPIPEKEVFWAGRGFNTIIYTRDIAYSAFLGSCFLYPDIVRSHLEYTRKLRRSLGWKIPESHKISIKEIPAEIINLTEPEVSDYYNTNSYVRRTDDVVWILGWWAYFETTNRIDTLTWMIEEFEYFDEHFYKYFYDSDDGLYRGQPTFIDVGGSGYPGYTINQSVMVKALSTNCLYVAAFDRLKKACELTGNPEKAAAYGRRAQELRASINARFKNRDGRFMYLLDFEGKHSDRQEILGLAFLVLFDVVSPDQFKNVLDYQGGDFGAPLIWPFFDNTKVYHNNSTWPFADTLFAKACWKQSRSSELLLHTLAKLCRHSLRGTFNEILEYNTGRFAGGDGYLWSAASYLTVIYDFICGIKFSGGALTFEPFLPKELGNIFTVDQIRIGHSKISLRLYGNGSKVTKMIIDGRDAHPQEPFKPNDDDHIIELYLT